MAQQHIRILKVLAILAAVTALNPFISNEGVADPHIRVYDGHFFLYATSDFSNSSRGFKNERWWVWNSSNLVDWSLSTILYPNQTSATPAESTLCWATDGATRNGFFYFYLSTGTTEIGVVRSTTPVGPWDNVLGQPLVSKDAPLSPPTESRDPGVLADTDGKFYLVWGTFNYFIAELADDMMSFVGAPRYVVVNGATSQNGVGVLDDKPYLHKRGSLYYLSFGCFYATSTSLWGPFDYVGTWIDLNLIAPDFRTNVSNPNASQWWHNEDYNDRHGSFFSAGGQDFWSSNDRSHSTDRFNTNAYRDPILTYVHYFANASIAPVVINGFGVGEYDASAVEFENYMRAEGGARKLHVAERDDAFVVSVDNASAVLVYPRVHNCDPANLALSASNVGTRPVTVHARVGAASGDVLATCTVAPTHGRYVSTACASSAGGGQRLIDVAFTFDGGELLLDHFSCNT